VTYSPSIPRLYVMYRLSCGINSSWFDGHTILCSFRIKNMLFVILDLSWFQNITILVEFVIGSRYYDRDNLINR
jgi:hypothetical protein